MNAQEYQLFVSLRRRIAAYITKYLEDDCGHKSYEGTWELLVSYPNYFEDKTATAKPNFYRVTLHCYVLGPGRHYDWDGDTWMEALQKCASDIDDWIAQES